MFIKLFSVDVLTVNSGYIDLKKYILLVFIFFDSCKHLQENLLESHVPKTNPVILKAFNGLRKFLPRKEASNTQEISACRPHVFPILVKVQFPKHAHRSKNQRKPLQFPSICFLGDIKNPRKSVTDNKSPNQPHRINIQICDSFVRQK